MTSSQSSLLWITYFGLLLPALGCDDDVLVCFALTLDCCTDVLALACAGAGAAGCVFALGIAPASSKYSAIASYSNKANKIVNWTIPHNLVPTLELILLKNRK